MAQSNRFFFFLPSHPSQIVPRERSPQPCRDSSSPPHLPGAVTVDLAFRRGKIPPSDRRSSLESGEESAFLQSQRPCGRPSSLSWLHRAKSWLEAYASQATTSWLDRTLRDMWEKHEFCGFQARCTGAPPVQLARSPLVNAVRQRVAASSSRAECLAGWCVSIRARPAKPRISS